MADYDFELFRIAAWTGFFLLVLSGMVIGACLHSLWMKRKQPRSPRRESESESGNIFFAMFAVVGMVGLIGASMTTIMKGPVASMQNVTKRTIAENNLIAGARLALVSAATMQPDSGDCDADGFVEPIPFRDAGSAPHPAGGGLMPVNIGAALTDPWGRAYGYCVWDHGSEIKAAGCGGAGANRLAGTASDTQYALAVISAGPDGTFQTSCHDFADTDGDGAPDIPLVNKPSGSDDIVLGHTYAEANSAVAGLWSLKQGEPDTAKIDKGIEVEGGGFFGGSLILGGGLLLPDQNSSGACIEANDQQLRRNTSASPPTLEICDWQDGAGDWKIISGKGKKNTCEDISLGDICYIDGAIYIGNAGGKRVYAAPDDESPPILWKTSNTATTSTKSLTDGFANTAAMNNAEHPAAHSCARKVPVGTWYLPAKDELNLIWTNKEYISLIHEAHYWSSTEGDNIKHAWWQRFDDGEQHYGNKNNSMRVRCVRQEISDRVTLEKVLASGNTAGNQKITDLAAPTDDLDAVNKLYLDMIVASAGGGGGGGMACYVSTPHCSGNCNMSSNAAYETVACLSGFSELGAYDCLAGPLHPFVNNSWGFLKNGTCRVCCKSSGGGGGGSAPPEEEVPEACKTGPIGTICDSDGAFYIGDMDGNRIYAAPADEGIVDLWSTGTSLTHANSHTDGLFNTTILRYHGAAQRTAIRCAAKPPAGTWYLPAKDELTLIWTNRADIDLAGKGFFTTSGDYYWSSTEGTSSSQVWMRWFLNDYERSSSKTGSTAHIRCVRR